VSQLGRDVDDGLSVIDGVARILAVNGEGKGVPQNYVRAYMWYNLAASQYASSPHYELYERDRESAEKLRDILARKMTPAQIAEAQRLAREWKPKKEE
jgi:uncharacterized protein